MKMLPSIVQVRRLTPDLALSPPRTEDARADERRRSAIFSLSPFFDMPPPYALYARFFSSHYCISPRHAALGMTPAVHMRAAAAE